MAELIAAREGDAGMLNRIQITRCLNLYGVIEVIQEISATLTTTTTTMGAAAGPGERIGMVVIDSISNPVALMMQKGQTPGHDLMVCVMRELTVLSRRDVSVLLVNATVRADPRRREEGPGAGAGGGGGGGSNRDAAFSGVQIKPALGNTWPHLVDYSMLIYPVPEGTVRVPGKRGYIQEIIRSRVGGTGEWEMCWQEIDPQGVT
ncbi:protein of unknown function [Taphrina deformans PYCC 5710]|uniref:DNA recombination and repair protein Rad51-like C-terminal domain-containing protein n=1 Tax=Taphrina deformans (strain PYCC 5710 / ATCC 11124 / CBS 356.35 / IMI 108563 / JCM 9778 / NBRC 8474) TaxID=1097556 RepID=R4XEI5_TAPDE|nr:protein of unknown function [Taphrina deformans PYCC 5710]|eukprot:CCG84072.1 protein of unknown function [Taphrina deformans PYCC 5710]